MSISIETNGSRSFGNAAAKIGLSPADLGHIPDIRYVPYGGVIHGVQSNYITIVDVRDLARTVTVNPFNYCIIHTHAHTWGVPQCTPYGFAVFYPPGLEWNVTMPPHDVGAYHPTVYDAIWDTRGNQVKRWDINAPFEYGFDTFIPWPEEHKNWIAEIATGWSGGDLYNLVNAATEYINDYEIWRLTWLVGCHSTRQGPPRRWIHPWHHRPLTLGEISCITDVRIDPSHECRQSNLPTLMDELASDVPNNLAEWLLQQCLYCLNNAWHGNGVDNAVEFNLYDARPMAWNEARFPDEARKQFHNFDYKKWGL